MKTIRIISGSYGYRNPVNRHLEPVSIGETCDVKDEEAARLVNLGVAEIVSGAENEVKPVENASEVRESEAKVSESGSEISESEAEVREEAETDESAEENAEDGLESLSAAEIKRLAKERGINITGLKKAEIIKAIRDEEAPEPAAGDIVG